MSCSIKNGKYFAPNGEESLLYKNLRENMSEDEANDLFVLSKTPSFQENIVAPLIESHRGKVLEIPTNIKFKETFANKIRTFHLYDGKSKVGRIQLTPYKDGFKVKSSLIDEGLRGKGFGKYLYNYAISRLLLENNTFYTDTARTEDADRIWETLKKQGLSQEGKSVKPLPKEFDKNGEIGMDVVLQYTADNFSQTSPLNAVEKSHLINLQIEGVETSDDLYNALYGAFYKNNLFSPNISKLKKIYSEDEIRNILEDSEIQGRVKETIEKLRQTEEFTIPQIKYNKDFDVRSSKVNIIGQYKKQNPLKLEQQVKEQDYVKVPVINETGEQLETQLFYENAIKSPSDKTIRALQAIVGAHPMVDTVKLENKLIRDFKNYGMDIEGIERESFKELLNYVTTPTDENRKALEDALGFVREPLTKPINISPENRTYQYLKTAKSEQELFDEMSLIQTTTPNVYHKVNKIDKQEMRDIVSESQVEEEEIPILDFIKGTEANDYIEYNGMFSKTTTGTSYDDVFEDKTGGKLGYFFFYKKEKARIEMMSPDEYLREVRRGFNTIKDENLTPQSRENILKGIEKGNKIDMPYLNYIDGRFNQEGRNRANLAKERGEKLIPVMVLNSVSKQDLQSVSDDMLENLTDKYNFKSKDELLDVVVGKYKLHRDAKRYIETNILEDYSFFNERGKLEYKKLDSQDLTIADYQLYKVYYGYKTPEVIKEVQSEMGLDSEYLLNDFIADFSAEKLKNPTEFNRQFKVTETGIELASNDIITLETVKAYIQDGAKYSKEISEYSLLSKEIPNLKEKDSFIVASIIDKRIKAINDINSVNKPTTEITIIDEDSFSAPNETQQFLRVGDEVYEQQEQGYYNKLQKNTNPNFFNLNPKAPEFKNFDIQQEINSENKAKKFLDKETNDENFSCI